MRCYLRFVKNGNLLEQGPKSTVTADIPISIQPEQAGFRSEYGTTDHIHILYTTHTHKQKTEEFNQPLFLVFVTMRRPLTRSRSGLF